MSALLAASAAVGLGLTAMHLHGWALVWLAVLAYALAPSDS